MPAWTTPLLWPVWCWASSGSRSSTTTLAPGRRRFSSQATASPRMPPPTTAMSCSSADTGPEVSRTTLDSRPVQSGNGKRVLVTGAAGFIGSHVADGCLELGMEVVATDDLSGGFRENVPDGAELDRGRSARRRLRRRRCGTEDGSTTSTTWAPTRPRACRTSSGVQLPDQPRSERQPDQPGRAAVTSSASSSRPRSPCTARARCR